MKLYRNYTMESEPAYPHKVVECWGHTFRVPWFCTTITRTSKTVVMEPCKLIPFDRTDNNKVIIARVDDSSHFSEFDNHTVDITDVPIVNMYPTPRNTAQEKLLESTKVTCTLDGMWNGNNVLTTRDYEQIHLLLSPPHIKNQDWDKCIALIKTIETCKFNSVTTVIISTTSSEMFEVFIKSSSTQYTGYNIVHLGNKLWSRTVHDSVGLCNLIMGCRRDGSPTIYSRIKSWFNRKKWRR